MSNLPLFHKNLWWLSILQIFFLKIVAQSPDNLHKIKVKIQNIHTKYITEKRLYKQINYIKIYNMNCIN